MRDRPPQQQTLTAALDWSYALLNSAEQQLLVRLAVFVGGWTIEAARAICAGGEDLPLLDSVEHALTGLLDQSLVEWVPDSAPRRFRLLEPIHEYAQTRLVMSGEGPQVARRHAAYYCALAEAAEPHLRSAQQLYWLARLEVEHPNLRAALQWAHNQAPAETLLRLAGALARFWVTRGYLEEGRQWLESAVAASAVAPVPLQAKALNGLGLLTWRLGQASTAREHLLASLALWQTCDDPAGEAGTYYNLGLVANGQGDYAAAETYFSKSLQHWRALGRGHEVAAVLFNLGIKYKEQGDYAKAEALFAESLTIQQEQHNILGIAHALNGLGMVANGQGNRAPARTYYEESLALFQTVGDTQSVAALLNNLGNVARELQDSGGARAYYEEGLRLRRAGEDKRGLAFVLHNLGNLLVEEGEFEQARAHYLEGLALRQPVGDRWGIADSLVGLAEIAARSQIPEGAIQLLGAAAQIRMAMGAVVDADEAARAERILTEAQSQLTPEARQLAWEVGQQWSVEEAITATRQLGEGE